MDLTFHPAEAHWIDLTRPLRVGMPVYPGDPPFEREMTDDGTYRVSTLRMSAHCGTHIDAPAHCLPGGATVDQIALETLNGVALVIKAEQIESLAPAVSRLLIKSARGISLRQAETLIALGVRLVGVQGQSVADGEEETAVHRALLSAGVLIVENLELSGVSIGAYELTCLPLNIQGAEAAPVRAMARKLDHIDWRTFFA